VALSGKNLKELWCAADGSSENDPDSPLISSESASSCDSCRLQDA
jgi:hypothetical protein